MKYWYIITIYNNYIRVKQWIGTFPQHVFVTTCVCHNMCLSQYVFVTTCVCHSMCLSQHVFVTTCVCHNMCLSQHVLGVTSTIRAQWSASGTYSWIFFCNTAILLLASDMPCSSLLMRSWLLCQNSVVKLTAVKCSNCYLYCREYVITSKSLKQINDKITYKVNRMCRQVICILTS